MCEARELIDPANVRITQWLDPVNPAALPVALSCFSPSNRVASSLANFTGDLSLTDEARRRFSPLPGTEHWVFRVGVLANGSETLLGTALAGRGRRDASSIAGEKSVVISRPVSPTISAASNPD